MLLSLFSVVPFFLMFRSIHRVLLVQKDRKFRWKAAGANGSAHQATRKISKTLEQGYDVAVGESTSGPLAFTHALPDELQNVDLTKVPIITNNNNNNNSSNTITLVDPDSVTQRPLSPLLPDRMGLHPLLIETLKDKHNVTALTPIQARLLQYFYAKRDIAICASTGSGKTLGLCIGAVARLMRESPPTRMSTIFIVPTIELGLQTERWLRQLWWYTAEEDPFFLHHLTEANESRFKHVDNVKPYIVLGTAEVLWAWVKSKTVNLSPSTRSSHMYGKLAECPLPSVDTIIIDEVDSVLPVKGLYAVKEHPGNLLMHQLYHPQKFQAPPHVILNSATFAPSTVNHVRHFMKNSIFASMTVRLFPDEAEDGTSKGGLVVDTIDDATAVAGAVSRTKQRYSIPPEVNHLFYITLNFSQQLERMLDCCSRFEWSRVLVIVKDNTQSDDDDGVENEQVDDEEQKWIDALSSRDELKASIGEIIPLSDAVKRLLSNNNNSSSNDAPHRPLPQRCVLVGRAESIRGIDIPDLDAAVITCTPEFLLDFVHWSGRVGRLGKTGTCMYLLHPTSCRVVGDHCANLNITFNVEK